MLTIAYMMLLQAQDASVVCVYPLINADAPETAARVREKFGIAVSADVRTNCVIFSAGRTTAAACEAVIKELDAAPCGNSDTTWMMRVRHRINPISRFGRRWER